MVQVQPKPNASPKRSKTILTLREQMIMEMLLDCMNNRKKICNKLKITDGTLRNHLNNIYNKLGALNRLHAVIIYVNLDENNSNETLKQILLRKPKTMYEIDDPEIRNIVHPENWAISI